MSTDLLEKSPPQPVPPSSSGTTPAPGVPPVKRPPSRQNDDDGDEEEPGFFRRFRIPLALGAVAVAGGIYAFSGPSAPSDFKPVRKALVPINIQLPPPPLPPPPPPPPAPPKIEQPREEQMEEQAPVADDSPPEPEPDNSPPPIGTNITGNGPADGFGLGKATGGAGNGTGRRVGGGGSKFGYYAAQVQNSITSALRRNSKTKSATLSVTARIWADETGRVTKAMLSGTSGDPAVDATLTNEILTGLQLQSPPPAGMKMPINLRLTARPPR